MNNKIKRLALMNTALAGFIAVNTSLAVQPLSEEDMSGVSLDSGLNLLNVYGPPAAGISSEVSVEVATPDEESPDKSIETAADSANELIEDAETALEGATGILPNQELSFKDVEEAIKAGDATFAVAQSFDSSSEISYATKDFHHDADFLGTDDVVHTRDLQIDSLKFENLVIDPIENNPSIGNIYLSDWESRGSSRITVD